MAEYDDLLLGLGSDDFNDFGDVEGDTTEQELGEDVQPWEEDPFPLPCEVVSAVTPPIAFANARGKVLPPPSKAAQDRIRKIFDEVEEDGPEIEIMAADEISDATSKRRRLNDGNGSLFTTANGAAAAPLSREAIANAVNLFGESDATSAAAASRSLSTTGAEAVNLTTVNDADSSRLTEAPTMAPSGYPAFVADTGSSSDPSSTRSLFTTGSGGYVPPISRSAATVAARLFNDVASAPIIQATSAFTYASGTAAPVLSKASTARAMAVFGENAPSLFGAGGPSGPDTSSRPTPSIPLARAASGTISASSFQTPSRMPLRPTTNTFAHRHDTTPSLRSIDIKTPGTQRRIGLGSTPGSQVKRNGKRGFVTPFKHGIPATPLALRGSVAGPSQPAKPTPKVMEDLYEPVFNLTPPPGRSSLRDSYLHPQYTSVGEMREMGLPDEIWGLDLTNAAEYHFISEDASVLDYEVALQMLKREQCHLATKKWVRNHWEMILWKLAGEIQAKPGLFDQKWNWGEVIDQLKYRYEREFGAAQRPIIRRIYEHDSSPSLPMVLCVSAVHQPGPAADDTGLKVEARPYLEVTDGWYRIYAEVDECLARAIFEGKIVAGGKLAISGAKLESSGDGADALDSSGSSRLVLTGNSCHLARWHSKLGLQSAPFIAGLSSLSVDGGIVVLMDVRLEKVFPLAFLSSGKGAKGGPWSEEEERSREDQWRDKYAAEKSRLHDDMRKRLEKFEDLAELLGSHAEDIAARSSGTPPDSLESDFDKLLDAKDVMSRIRGMSGANIVHLAEYARGQVQVETSEGQKEVQAELQVLCPERNVRDFRMVRFVDAQEGKKEAARVGMLNVWDAKGLGEGALEEGKRYLVSNLMPGRSGDWQNIRPGGRAEIYLNTRRDTRWKPIEQ